VTAQAGSTSAIHADPSYDSPAARRERARVRKEIRRLRRTLDEERRAAGERALSRLIQSLPVYRQARTVALYYAFDGEPSLARVALAAARHGKRVYAPVVVGERMHFAPIAPTALLRRNLFGIQEPRLEHTIDPRRLDLVLTPLVAFDPRGVRLGVGRGYYDRAFRFLRHRKSWTRPKLLGVAWSFQQVPELSKQPWDVPLWGTITEAAFLRFAGTAE
jgi:5-formyltetrahydrofolate cyclo-ligase